MNPIIPELMYAIVEISGKQLKVEKDQRIYVNRMNAKEGDKVDLSNVMLLDNDGKVEIGTPYLKKANVKAKVLGHLRGDKVTIFKKKRRKGFQSKNGHRQDLSYLEVEKIETGGKQTESKESTKEEEKKAETKSSGKSEKRSSTSTKTAKSSDNSTKSSNSGQTKEKSSKSTKSSSSDKKGTASKKESSANENKKSKSEEGTKQTKKSEDKQKGADEKGDAE